MGSAFRTVLHRWIPGTFRERCHESLPGIFKSVRADAESIRQKQTYTSRAAAFQVLHPLYWVPRVFTGCRAFFKSVRPGSASSPQKQYTYQPPRGNPVPSDAALSQDVGVASFLTCFLFSPYFLRDEDRQKHAADHLLNPGGGDFDGNV
jgi:hypothetical protein